MAPAYDRITWREARLIDNGTNGFLFTRHCQPCWAGDSPSRIKPQASVFVPVLFFSLALSLSSLPSLANPSTTCL